MQPRCAPLPIKDGISPSYIWLPEGQWAHALAFLCAQFPDVSEAVWRARFARQEVRAANGDILHETSPVKRGMCLYYYREVENETPIPFQARILYQDEHLLVADKPHFLPVTPGGHYLRETLLVRLKQATGITNLSPLHRLDRETAGVILFSVSPQSRGAYQQLFQRREIHKIYHALAPHLPQVEFPHRHCSRLVESERFFVMQEIPGEANSDTLIDILERRGSNTLYQLQPSTGKKHQLRVHLASLGAAIVNDLFYPTVHASGSDDYQHPLQLLAKSIRFTDPITGAIRRFDSEQEL